ncbi:hypothetical protein H0H93_014501 [Arthromyces matolae]|nr:hypothetical protein H0H93_014501 [Arthromyces matolae]
MSDRTSKRRRLHVHHDRVPLNLPMDYSTISARQERLTRNSRTTMAPRVTLRGDTAWHMSSTWEEPRDDGGFGLEPNGVWLDDNATEPVDEHPKKEKRKGKGKGERLVSKRPHLVWKNTYRSAYLDELLRWEGRGDHCGQSLCPDCVQRKVPDPGLPKYRCLDCFIPDLVCKECCVRRHRLHPLHVIEEWNDTFFSRVQLKDLGLTIQLGHSSLHCASYHLGHAKFKVLHTNGIHDVAIRYCGCERALPHHVQLLRRGLYPSSQKIPKTCASFTLLRLLHALSLCSKASTYDFHRTLQTLTDNTGLKKSVSKYRPLVRVAIQWRHLKLLKRGGRGHYSQGVEQTKEGELVVPCLTCPRPGVNLPEGWEKASEGQRFLYQLILCMDANFRLKNQLVSSFSSDPGLGTGWAYMVPRATYEEYLKSQATAQDVSTCVGFSALAKANTKFSRGLRYTGVGALTCARSEMFLPCAVGNLQKGENYDIACQWIVNIGKRMMGWPQGYQVPLTTELRPAIPKMHETAHMRENHERLSLHYLPGVGLTDGESVERIWAGHNALGNATKTMGPGTRHDVLDDHFGFWNWQKYVGTGKTLSKKFREAVKLRNNQVEAHEGFSATISKERLEEWEAMCLAWDRERYPKNKSRNPFHVENSSISEAQVKKELAEEEDARLRAGEVARHATSASTFLVLGLELEEEQRRITSINKKTSSTTTQQGSLAEQRNQLRKKLTAWELIRGIYMPGLLQYRTDNPITVPTDNPEDQPLWLPSSIPADKRHAVCVADLPTMEEKLRTAQCYDALDTIRRTLNMKARMIQFKNANIRGQRDGTRSRAIIDRVQDRARFTSARYIAARSAKLALAGSGPWEGDLQVLRPEDIRMYTDPERVRQGPGRPGTIEADADVDMSASDSAPGIAISLLPEERGRRDGTGETRRTVSWIWVKGQASHAAGDENDDLLRSEWSKSRARVARAVEEVALVKEEMRRAGVTLLWRAQVWRNRDSRESGDKALLEGLQAYSEEQAVLQESLRERFMAMWKDPLAKSTTKKKKNNDTDNDSNDNEMDPDDNEDKDDNTNDNDNNDDDDDDDNNDDNDDNSDNEEEEEDWDDGDDREEEEED